MIRPTYTLFCDLCPNWAGQEPSQTMARSVAKARGFIRRKVNGRMRDLCPECAADVP